MMGALRRHDAADDAAVRVHLSDREHAVRRCVRSRTSCRRAGSCSIARGIMLKGVGLDVSVARDAGARWRWRWCCWRRARARSTSGWTIAMRAHPVSRARRGAARRPRPRDAGADAGRADRAAADAVERGDVRDPQHADLRRRFRSDERVARARQPVRGVRALRHRRRTRRRPIWRTRRCSRRRRRWC